MIEIAMLVLLIWELYRLSNVDNLVTVSKYLTLTKEQQKKVMEDNPIFRMSASKFLSTSLLIGLTYIVLGAYFYISSHAGGLASIVTILFFRLVMFYFTKSGIKQHPENENGIRKTRYYLDIAISSTILAYLLYWILTGVF